MGRRAEVDEVHDVPFLAKSDVASRIIELVQEEPGCSPATVTLDQVSFVRAYRPRWASVVGFGLCWAVLPALFLLVRTSERFSVEFLDDHRGLRVRLSGRLTGSLRARMVEVFSARPAGPLPVVSGIRTTPVAAPAGVPRLLADAPGADAESPKLALGCSPGLRPTPPFDAPAPPVDETVHQWLPGRPGPAPVVLGLVRDGEPSERAVRIEAVALLGRAPARRADDPEQVELVPVADDTVSKTHAAVRADADGLWVTDRGSTNGTVIIDLSGSERRAEPGQPARVEVGERLRLGAHALRVVEL